MMLETALSSSFQGKVPLESLGEVRSNFQAIQRDQGADDADGAYRLNRHLMATNRDVFNLDEEMPEVIQQEIKLFVWHVMGNWKKTGNKGGKKKITLAEILIHLSKRWSNGLLTEVQQAQVVFHGLLRVGQYFRDQIEQYLLTKETRSVERPSLLYSGHVQTVQQNAIAGAPNPLSATEVANLHEYHSPWIHQEVLLGSAKRAMAVLVGVEDEVSWDELHEAEVFEYMQTDEPSQLIKRLVAGNLGEEGCIKGSCLAMGVRHGIDIRFLMDRKGKDLESLRWTEGSLIAIEKSKQNLGGLSTAQKKKITDPEEALRMTAAIEAEINAGRTYDLIYIPLGLQFGNEDAFCKKLALLYKCLNPGGTIVFGLEAVGNTTTHGMGMPLERDYSKAGTNGGIGKKQLRSAVTFSFLDHKKRIHLKQAKINAILMSIGFKVTTETSMEDSNHLFKGQEDAEMLYFAAKKPCA